VNTAPANLPNLERQAWDHNYVILETQGRGHYIGCNLSVTNTTGNWWGEGDDMIWVDGYKWPPDLHGTGTRIIWAMPEGCSQTPGCIPVPRSSRGAPSHRRRSSCGAATAATRPGMFSPGEPGAFSARDQSDY
jgi:hypothetical protein